jgi:hypothetical protein
MFSLSQERVLQLVLAISLASSLGGILYATWFGTAVDGQRGGAIAVAISFAALFAARSTPQDVIETKDATGNLVVDHGGTEKRIGLLRTAIATMIDSQRLEKVYLTWSSTTGTLVWGFGDLIASWLGAPAVR